MSDLGELLIAAFQHQINEVYTAIPAIIVNVRDINQQRVDVKPVVNMISPNGEYEEHPVILSVPLIFPSTKTSAITFEVSNGDEVLLVFAQRCIDTYKASGGIVNPLDMRRFDKRDAVAFVGMSNFAKAINNPKSRTWKHSPSDTVIAHNIGTANEVEVRLKKDGGLSISTKGDVEVNCNEATINGDLSVNGSINCSETITATTDVVGGGKSLKTHTHGGVKTGTDTSGPPT